MEGEALCDTVLCTTRTGPELMAEALPAGSSQCPKARAF